MKTIWKFQFDIADRVQINMPKGAKILSVQDQASVACILAIVNTNAELETRVFAIYGTGHELSDTPMTFVASFQQDMFVWHVFEL